MTHDADEATSDPPMRAHARRNREALLAAATSTLASAGDTVSLEAIARDAGVGIGTLYRHYPTRQALFEAVYAAQLDDLTASAEVLLEQHEPADALRRWIGRYAEFAATKRGVIDTLRAGLAAGRLSPNTTRQRINAAIRPLLDAGARDGSLRGGVDADDVTALLVGVFLSTTPRSDPDQTERLLDLVLVALRP